MLQALGTVVEVRDAGPLCADILNGARVTLPFVANIGVIDAEGGIRCSALPITGAIQAHKVLDRELPANTLLQR